jgi:hypothetical protein
VKEIEFFRSRDIKETDFIDIAKVLKYEFVSADKNVFEYGKLPHIIFIFLLNFVGSIGDKFYVTIKGSVGVQIMNPKVAKKRLEEEKQPGGASVTSPT